MLKGEYKYLNVINTILKDKVVKENVDFLLKETQSDPLTTNYFGINYTEEEFKSLKIYFSFASYFPQSSLKNFGISDKDIELIKNYWEPVDKLSFFHQGLTLGLKCYIKSNKIVVNKYFHFRTKNEIELPKQLKLTRGDFENYPGICKEYHGNLNELKYYYYIQSEDNVKSLLNSFQLSDIINLNEVDCVEYTESNLERKINIVAKNCDSVSKCINNKDVIELSEYLYKTHKLYYQGPGFRDKSNVRAIYFFPKQILSKIAPFQSFSSVFKE